MKVSCNQPKVNPELGAINGVSSSVKGVDSVEPQWPLQNRLRKASSSVSSRKASKYSTVEIPPFAPKQADDSSSSLVSDQAGVPKVIEDQDMVDENLNTAKLQTFSSLLGAWKKPIPILSPTLQQQTEAMYLHEPNNSDWPALSSGKSGTRNCGHPLIKDAAQVSEKLDAEQASLKAHSKEYPWAARMNQSMRNLHRVTIPEYMEDGTPKVRIPSHVLLGGLENQKEFVVGQFYRCLAPTGGQIQDVVTRIWGRKCRIFTRKLGDSTYLFHIPDESTQKWVIQRGLWHVDDCLMFVSPWSPSDTISIPEITTVPVWLTLLNIPDQLYSILGIKWIASGIGEPLLTEKPWLDPTQMGKAKILVEVKLDKPFLKRVALLDRSDSITMVDVLYSWLPSMCSGCGQFGHKASRCLLLSAKTSQPLSSSYAHKNITNSDDAIASKSATSASPNVEVSNSSTSMESGSKETPEPIVHAPVLVSPMNMKTITSSAQVTTKVLLNEVSTPKQITLPSVNADVALRRSLSSLALSTNRFASLDSSDDDDSDDDNDIPAFNDMPNPVEFMTDKRILRERPVRMLEKAKEWHMKSENGGRGNGNRGRGRRGGRG